MYYCCAEVCRIAAVIRLIRLLPRTWSWRCGDSTHARKQASAGYASGIISCLEVGEVPERLRFKTR